MEEGYVDGNSSAPPKAPVSTGADLGALQNELKAAKEKWPDAKLGKAKKESETFPYPVWLLLAVQQPESAKAYDVCEIPVKLVVEGLEPGNTSVEVPSSEIPKQLQAKIADAILATWTKHVGKKASSPWSIVKTLEWVETNFTKMLSLDPECISTYQGVDENGATVRRFAIQAPPEPAEEEEEETDSEEEDAYAQEMMAQRIAELLAECSGTDSSGKKKLSEAEIERKKAEAAEMGEKAKMLSKAEKAELNKSRKEKAGHRTAKTGQAHRKFEGDGATSKEEKKKKAAENVKKRFGIA
jgi:hypothetical protein